MIQSPVICFSTNFVVFVTKTIIAKKFGSMCFSSVSLTNLAFFLFLETFAIFLCQNSVSLTNLAFFFVFGNICHIFVSELFRKNRKHLDPSERSIFYIYKSGMCCFKIGEAQHMKIIL